MSEQTIDKGEFTKEAVEIVPVLNGGYVVMRGRVDPNNPYVQRGPERSMAFTDYKDMLAWLVSDYAAANAAPSPAKGQGDE